ncbi:hypothetical protein PMAYCL1PPCAC_06544, partial [Pristionchus mayeri]
VTVKGRLTCGALSTSNQTITIQDVRLMEYDAVGSNDLINVSTSDGDGRFEVSGGQNEYWGHEFFLEIRLPCWRTGRGSFTACQRPSM